MAGDRAPNLSQRVRQGVRRAVRRSGGWPRGAANGDQPAEEALADRLREQGASGGGDQRHGERGALSE